MEAGLECLGQMLKEAIYFAYVERRGSFFFSWSKFHDKWYLKLDFRGVLWFVALFCALGPVFVFENDVSWFLNQIAACGCFPV